MTVYLTERVDSKGAKRGARIKASSWEEADKICAGKGWGRVVGILVHEESAGLSVLFGGSQSFSASYTGHVESEDDYEGDD